MIVGSIVYLSRTYEFYHALVIFAPIAASSAARLGIFDVKHTVSMLHTYCSDVMCNDNCKG